ncbi:unnamed protein product [Phytophthora fragariaefolia]|uniref:Unnamed protein product n=1 Tax=Phytophthora fragariaefolia TaxID=1490495 RepID=A0A9W6X581_9STRA|nr:unnamed protein product [Phytophthora fragariaefolia]
MTWSKSIDINHEKYRFSRVLLVQAENDAVTRLDEMVQRIWAEVLPGMGPAAPAFPSGSETTSRNDVG